MSSTCRLSGELYPASLFRSIACARCLFFIYFVTAPYSDRYTFGICETGLLICNSFDNSPCSCEASSNKIFNIPEYSINSSLSQPLEKLNVIPELPPEFVIITQQCCDAATKCCDNVLATDSADVKTTKTSYMVSRDLSDREGVLVSLDEKATCPATWDGWQCFERSKPGTVNKKCPNYIFGDRLRNDVDDGDNVQKQCLDDGEWLKKQWGQALSEWTDYSGCVINQQFTLKLIAGIVAFSITVISIIPAIIIISTNNCLKKQIVFRIHKHLLYSFLFSGLFYLFNCFFFVIDGAIGDYLYFVNHISCRVLFTLQLRYFRLSTFTWMLGEGVYLYRLLMCTFSSEAESLKPYYILCWGFPLVVTIAYSALRQVFDNEECWVSPSKVFWIEWTIIGPCLIALCINLLLVTMILYVLIKKLRYNPHLEPVQYTKAVRAVFMLVPVFGLHFLITIYRIQSTLHQIINLVLDGMQGFVVALIVCYTNRTVIECLRKWIENHLEARKLRRQSEDQRTQFKRSIETSFAGDKLFPTSINNNQDTNGSILIHHLSRDSDDNEESADFNALEMTQRNRSVVTGADGSTTIIPTQNLSNFV